MKKISHYLLGLFFVGASISVQAQDMPAIEASTPRMTADTQEMGAKNKKAKLYKELNLSDDQISQVDALLKTQKEELVALRGSDVERREKREQVQSMKSKHQDEMASILSTEQMVTYREMLSKRAAKMKGKRKGPRSEK